MNYDEAIAFWYGRIDYERRTPKPGDLKLDRMRWLLRLLDQPQSRFRTIHVAGTKGKGSTAAMLEEILRQAGYRTGLFTSPHLSTVEERMRVDGKPITKAELAVRLTEIEPAVREMDASGDPQSAPTFFEVGTALGFLHFVCRGVEIAVVEVGLGGRFDSTNVVAPLVSVITSISFDHMAQLGNKLSMIAREKAGIIKPRRPVISGATAPEAREVIEAIAQQRSAPLTEVGRHVKYLYVPAKFDGETTRPRSLVEVLSQYHWPRMELNLLGEHQASNAAVALATVEQLRREGLHIEDSAVARGLAQVQWPARLEVMGERPWIVLDCAHNVASAEALVETLRQTFPKAKRRIAVFAASIDKDVPGILRALAPFFDCFYLTTYRNNPRTVAPERLAEWLHEIAPVVECIIVPQSEDAFLAARSAATSDDLIAVTGSVFLAGELRPLLLASSSGFAN